MVTECTSLPLLCQPWWQGVAGIAQIVAGILTIVAVLQAQAMIRRADQERREAVLPSFELDTARAGQQDLGEPPSDVQRWASSIVLRNRGPGRAEGVDATVDPDPRRGAVDLHVNVLGHVPGDRRLVEPGDSLLLTLLWSRAHPPSGAITVVARSRLGHRLEWKVRFHGRLDDAGEPQFQAALSPS